MTELNIQRHETLGVPAGGMVRVRARVANYYIETGDEIVTYPAAELPRPPVPLTLDGERANANREWLQVDLFGMTGTGRTRGNATYDLEIIESSHPDLVPVGYTHEWGY